MGLAGERVALMARKSLIIGRQIKDIRSVVDDDEEPRGGEGGGDDGRGGVGRRFNRRRRRPPTLSAPRCRLLLRPAGTAGTAGGIFANFQDELLFLRIHLINISIAASDNHLNFSSISGILSAGCAPPPPPPPPPPLDECIKFE